MAKKLEQLNEEFERSLTCDRELNAEKRTNISLYLGNHYLKSQDRISRELEKSGVDKSVKIRITKNHIFKICEHIKNSILSAGASIGIRPRNESELQDQKSAELHSAIFEKWKSDSKYKSKLRTFVSDFVIDGEVAAKVFWNPNKGSIISEEEYLNENNELKKRVTRSGEVELERIYCWDLKRPQNAKSMDDADWLGYEKMVSTKEIKAQVPPELRDKIADNPDDTFQVFDSSTGKYSDTKGKTLLREMYIKPCVEYPNGYFYIFNKDTILFEGELPFGIFPIVYKGFIEIPTSPRSISIIRQLRPLQIEVNRCASSQALTQLTLGMDKLIMLGGADLASGNSLSGVRVFKTNAIQSPTILPGRSGGQFVESMMQAITEMYQIANVPELSEEKTDNIDPRTALFKSIRNKQRFSLYASKFFEFQKEIAEKVLELKRIYMSEQEVVFAVGRSEQVNISEFKNSQPIGYQIALEEVDEDASSQLGKMINLTDMLQYGGQGMNKEMIALIGRNMPFLNKEEIFQEALIDYDTYKNTVLALDRGEQLQPTQADNADYMIPKIHSRMRKADFKYLDAQIQQNYSNYIAQLEQLKAQQLQQLKLSQSQLIPTTGALVPVPVYREVPSSTGGTKYERVQLPYDAINDLISKIESQGTVLDPYKKFQQSEQARISEIFNNGQQAV